MTKLKMQYEVSVAISDGNAKVMTIADITVKFYRDAAVQPRPWQENPAVLIVIESDQKTLKKFTEALKAGLGEKVTFRQLPHYME